MNDILLWSADHLSSIALAVFIVALFGAVWRLLKTAPPLPPRDEWESHF